MILPTEFTGLHQMAAFSNEFLMRGDQEPPRRRFRAAQGDLLVSDRCEECPMGHYQGVSGAMTDCTACPQGTYNPSAGAVDSAACLPCPRRELADHRLEAFTVAPQPRGSPRLALPSTS